MGGGRRGSGSKGGRLAAGWWSMLNTDYRNYLAEHGQKPERPWLEEWFDINARAAWPNGDQPTIQAAWDHCKCLRTLDQARDYFRQYRAKKKDQRDGAPARSSRKRNVDTDDTGSDDLEDDDEEGESSSQEDDDDNNGGPSRQRQPRKAPPARRKAIKSQPAAPEEAPVALNSVSMMQFQMMMQQQQQQQQQQQAMSYPQMMMMGMGGYPMASDPSMMGGMNPEAFNSFPFQMWQQQQQMLAMMMAQAQAQAGGGGVDASDLAQQQQAMAAAMMMAQQQQMAMMLHLHQQHALGQTSAPGIAQGQSKDDEAKVKEEEKTSPVDQGKEESEAPGRNSEVPPALPPPPVNPILGPVVMFPAAYASTVLPPYPALSTYGFDCSYSSSNLSNVPSLFMKTSPQVKKLPMVGAVSQASQLSERLRHGLMDQGFGNGSHCSSRGTEDRSAPHAGFKGDKGDEDSGGTSDRQPDERVGGFAKGKKRTSSSETMADENGMPLSHARRPPAGQAAPQSSSRLNSLDTLIAAAEAIRDNSEE